MLDWHRGIRTALAEMGARHGVERDWTGITNTYRRRALQRMTNQVNPDADPTNLLKRYPRAAVGKFNGQSEAITEMDALVAYLQMLGTLVRISDIPPERLRQ